MTVTSGARLAREVERAEPAVVAVEVLADELGEAREVLVHPPELRAVGDRRCSHESRCEHRTVHG